MFAHDDNQYYYHIMHYHHSLKFLDEYLDRVCVLYCCIQRKIARDSYEIQRKISYFSNPALRRDIQCFLQSGAAGSGYYSTQRPLSEHLLGARALNYSKTSITRTNWG